MNSAMHWSMYLPRNDSPGLPRVTAAVSLDWARHDTDGTGAHATHTHHLYAP
jgi:hypothetical protein